MKYMYSNLFQLCTPEPGKQLQDVFRYILGPLWDGPELKLHWPPDLLKSLLWLVGQQWLIESSWINVSSEPVSSSSLKSDYFLFPIPSNPGNTLWGKVEEALTVYIFVIYSVMRSHLKGARPFSFKGSWVYNWLESGNWLRGCNSVFMIQVKVLLTWLELFADTGQVRI